MKRKLRDRNKRRITGLLHFANRNHMFLEHARINGREKWEEDMNRREQRVYGAIPDYGNPLSTFQNGFSIVPCYSRRGKLVCVDFVKVPADERQ